MTTYSKNWFNPLYFIIRHYFSDPKIRTIFIFGGKSSSKTVTAAQEITIRCHDEGASALAFRKFSVDIPTTLKQTFTLSIDKLFLYPNFEKQDRKFNCFNGAEIIFKGIDDEEKAKGVEGYKYLLLDELNQFTKLEYEQFQLSLRGIPGQKIIGTWNPVDENSWVKVDLIDKINWINTEFKLPCVNSFVKISEDGRTVLIKTTYEDNYWIAGSPDGSYGYRDENLIAEYDAMMHSNYNSYKVNVLGEWGKTQYGGEFLKNWKSEIHTGVYSYKSGLAVYLMFDENVNPYFPCGIFQISENEKEYFLIHTIALRNPENTTTQMCREITRKLKEWDHAEVVFVGGDATSQKEDVKQEKGHDLFALIINGLQEFKPRRAVLSSNPSVKASADFTNSILGAEVYGLRFRVDKSCRVAISDFENTKEDKNGKVDKSVIRDPVSKITYQPYGHFVDILRYFNCFVFRKEYEIYQHGTLPFQNVKTSKRNIRNGF